MKPEILSVMFTTAHSLQGISQVVLVVKNLPTNVGDVGDLSSIPG